MRTENFNMTILLVGPPLSGETYFIMKRLKNINIDNTQIFYDDWIC